MPTRLVHIVFDSSDHRAQARWWSEVLSTSVAGEADDEAWLAPKDSPEIIFVPVPEPKTSKNRIHFDLGSESADHQRRTVDRLIELGARRIDIGQPKDVPWVVLADPEGNEFCVLPTPGVVPGTGPIAAFWLDAVDRPGLARFWSAASGWPIVYEDAHGVTMRSPGGAGPVFGTHAGPDHIAAKPVKNRVHLDVAPGLDDDHHAEVERLVAAGARHIDIGQEDVAWIVLADPEDNEFCVLTPR